MMSSFDAVFRCDISSTSYLSLPQEEKSKDPALKTDRRPRKFHQWGLDLETLVNAIRYKFSQMHKKLDQPVQSETYWCGNPGCYEYHKQIPIEDVVAGEYERKIHGARTMDAMTSAQLAKLNTATRGVATNLVKRPRFGAGARVSMSVKVNERGALVRGDDPQGLAPSSLNSALTTHIQEVKSQFHCRKCDEHLSEVSSSSGQKLADLKRRFNMQTSEITRQLQIVADLLKIRRELDAAQKEDQQSGKTVTLGVGARGGCSSATELAGRVEQRKQALAWEAQTEAERTALAEEEARKQRRDAEAARVRARQAEEQAREREEAEKRLEAQRREEEIRLTVAMFGPGAAPDNSAAEAAEAAAAAAAAAAEREAQLADQALMDQWNMDEFFDGDEVVANADAIVTVQGVEKRVGDITDEDRLEMTDEELSLYEQLIQS